MRRLSKVTVVLLLFVGSFLCVHGASTLRKDLKEADGGIVLSTEKCHCGPYGLCEFEGGLKKCKCVPLTSEFNGKCIECNCGEFSKHCSYSTNGTKVCDCDSDYIDADGTCTKCDCGPNGLCKIESGQKKCICSPSFIEVNGQCQACECGEQTDSCHLDSSGKKQCTCLPGYQEDNGFCAECDCGPRGRCIFEDGHAKCICGPFTSKKDGKCVDCFCGENSHFCYFNWNGDKVCRCHSGYSEAYGFCYDCKCGVNAQDCFYRTDGSRVCKCNFGYTQINGSCSAICSEDKCMHGKCEVVKFGVSCRCEEGYTGPFCEEKIKPNKPNLWMALVFSVTLAIFVLLSGMFCFWTRILNKMFYK